jgi:hypothetical protein
VLGETELDEAMAVGLLLPDLLISSLRAFSLPREAEVSDTAPGTEEPLRDDLGLLDLLSSSLLLRAFSLPREDEVSGTAPGLEAPTRLGLALSFDSLSSALVLLRLELCLARSLALRSSSS